MPLNIPNKVSLIVKRGESQKDFASRIFIEAARLAGLPLLQQAYFADYMIASGEHLFVGQDDKLRFKWRLDPSPNDKYPLVKDNEWQAKYGNWHTHILGDVNKTELANLQMSYLLSGGTLGSLIDVSPTEIITVDLKIVYDPMLITSDVPPQTDLEYVKLAMKRQLDYWSETYSKIGINYNVRYSIGTVNPLRQEITSGALPEMINIFYLNDPNSLKCYSKFNTGSRQIFLSELRGALLMESGLCHEAGHLFGIVGIERLKGVENYLLVKFKAAIDWVQNLNSDILINSALRRLKANNVTKGIDWIEDYQNPPKRTYYTSNRFPTVVPEPISYIAEHKLTIFDMLRFGAKQVGGK
jgi:hypothetical protein